MLTITWASRLPPWQMWKVTLLPRVVPNEPYRTCVRPVVVRMLSFELCVGFADAMMSLASSGLRLPSGSAYISQPLVQSWPVMHSLNELLGHIATALPRAMDVDLAKVRCATSSSTVAVTWCDRWSLLRDGSAIETAIARTAPAIIASISLNPAWRRILSIVEPYAEELKLRE